MCLHYFCIADAEAEIEEFPEEFMPPPIRDEFVIRDEISQNNLIQDKGKANFKNFCSISNENKLFCSERKYFYLLMRVKLKVNSNMQMIAFIFLEFYFVYSNSTVQFNAFSCKLCSFKKLSGITFIV